MAGSPFSPLASKRSQWRGSSARIYDVVVVSIAEAMHGEQAGRPGLAVLREGAGSSQVTRPAPQITSAWIKAATKRGATEIHALQVSPAEAERALADLQVMK